MTARLRGFGRDCAHPEPRRCQRVVPAVVVMIAGRSLLLDVRNLTVGREFPVVTGHATAREIRKAEKTNEAHHPKILLLHQRDDAANAAGRRRQYCRAANVSNSCT